jgi:hypothetical protein
MIRINESLQGIYRGEAASEHRSGNFLWYDVVMDAKRRIARLAIVARETSTRNQS